MNKNVYLNVVATLSLLVLVFFCWIMVGSVDLLRMRVESVAERVSGVEQRLAGVERGLRGGVRVAAGSAVAESAGEKVETSPVANLEFYDPAAELGGRLVNAIQTETKNLNYLINNESFVGTLWGHTYDSLAARNFERQEIFEPQMAESWEISDDKLTYTIRLRPGILWHDFTDPVTGKVWTDVEVTAHDFKFYVDVVKNPDVDAAPLRVYMQDLESIEVVSNYEFKVRWSRKYFLSESMTLGLSPLPRHLYHAYDGPFDGKQFNDDHARNRLIVGCGPYMFDRWDGGQRVVLRRWDKYYGRNLDVAPALEYIVYDVIQHPNTQLQALRSGEIDRMGMTPEQWVNHTDGAEFDPETGSIRKYKYPSRSYSYIGYNLSNPLFQDRRVRQALTQLVDRARIVTEVFRDLARITTGPFFIDSPYHDGSIEPFPFSVEKARELLGEAGWTDSDGDGVLDKDGQKFEFTMLAITTSEIQRRMLPIIQEDMAKAGVSMKIANVEWSVYTQRLENKSFDACTLGWSMGFESDPYQIWHSSQAEPLGTSNHIGFKNADADALIEQIRVEFDLGKRIELCHQFHRLLHEEQPYTFLVSPYSLVGQGARYRNVRVFSSGMPARIMWTPIPEQKQFR